MDISEFSDMWTTNKDEYALVNTDYGYMIVNIKEHNAVLISDEFSDAVIDKMLSEGVRTFDNINEVFGE